MTFGPSPKGKKKKKKKNPKCKTETISKQIDKFNKNLKKGPH